MSNDSDDSFVEGEIVSESESEEEGELHSDQEEPPMEAVQQFNLEFFEVISKMGKSLLTREGFDYQFEADSKVEENIQYWKCAKRIEHSHCPGRIHVIDQWNNQGNNRYKLGRIINGNHRHRADLERIHIRRAVTELKSRASLDNPISSRDAIDAIRRTMNPAVRVNAPSTSAMCQIYRRAKRRAEEEHGDRGLDVQNTAEIAIPDYLHEYLLLNQLVRIDNGNKRIVVFASEFSLGILQNYPNEIAVDGTFDTAPMGFTQIFTLHAVVDFCAIPVLFALLPSKHMQCYLRVFEALRRRLPNWAPNLVMSDFEQSELNAISEAFPNTNKTGCNFHLGNAIFKKIQQFPLLLQMYNNNDDYRHKLRCIQALAFVPEQEVYIFFCMLFEDIDPVPELFDLLQYVILTWIGPSYVVNHAAIVPSDESANYGANVDEWIRAWIEQDNLWNRDALFPIPLWNLTHRLQNGLSRTNNSLEGWHHVWAGLLRRRPRVSQFVRRMIKEFNRWKDVVIDFRNSPANGIRGRGIRRKGIYIQQDENLQQLFAEFENRANDPIQYLRSVSYHLARPN